jgi:hypothetical protein
VASSFRDTLTIGSFSVFSLNQTYFNPFLVKLAAEPIGINDKNDDHGFSVFPNPSSGQFNLQLKNGLSNSAVCIYDILGNCILSKPLESYNEVIDLSGKAKGMYLIEVSENNSKHTSKLIVN